MKRLISLMVGVFMTASLFGQGEDSLNMYQIFHWEDTTLLPAFFIDNIYNDVWGWYDSTKQREYAIVGSVFGVHFFDITDESNITEVATVEGKVNNDMIHRDFKNKDQYLYIVADEWSSSLQIVDMSYLPDSVHMVYDQDTLFGISHNIWIEGDRMYACIPRYWSGSPPQIGGLAVYDISNPEVPVLVQAYNQWGNIHDMYSRNDTVFLNAEFNGLEIVDLRDPFNPMQISSIPSYQYQGYNHSGWGTEDGKYYVFADETHGMPIKLVDLSDYSNPTISNYLFPGLDLNNLDSIAIPHNQIIRGTFVYSSYYYDGVYIFDIADPLNPVVVGYYDTYSDPDEDFYHGAWGVYPFLPSGRILVSDMQNGLFVLGYTGPYPTAIEPQLEQPFQIYPNPMKDAFEINWDSRPETVSLTLSNLQGQQIWSMENFDRNTTMTFSLPNGISPGMYVLRVQNKGEIFSQKILIH